MTDDNLLPISETLGLAWDKVKGSKGPMWGLYAIFLVLVIVLGFVGGVIGNNAVSMVIQLIIMVINLFATLGLAYMGLQRAQGLPIQIGMVKKVFTFSVFFRFIGLCILQVILFACFFAVIGALIWLLDGIVGHIISLPFLIAGGLIFLAFMLRICLALGFLLINEMGPWDSLVASYHATEGNVFRLFGLYILGFLIMFVSMIPLGIGLIWSVPLLLICYGEVFKKLVTTRQALTVQSK
ncbi:MAG: hypothetical protein P4M12_07220 [Gammaproteobacteria bacterium]|nr:hypothetical protein [Gammaproteobacteria bacterium]